MKKFSVIFFILSIVMYVHAMEIQPIGDDKKVCYLTYMPIEVQNIILSFVKDDETEEEFIARATSIKQDVFDGYKFCKKYGFCDTHGIDEFDEVVFCLDDSKFVFCKYSEEAGETVSRLILVDIKKNKALYSTKVNYHPQRFDIRRALSRNANIVARFEESLYQDLLGVRDTFITLHNIVTGQKWEIKKSIKFDDGMQVFEFNKQGTHLFIKGNNLVEEGGSLLPHLIIPINIIGVKKVNELLCIKDFNQKPPFQQYLIERRVCKSIGVQ